MRIVIDLQGAQSASRFRGIGRYSLALAQAIARLRGEHKVFIVLSSLFAQSIEPIRAAFEGILPQENIRVFHVPGPVLYGHAGHEARREMASIIREAYLAALKPDVLHISSLFEGYVDDALTDIPSFAHKVAVSVSLYDLIPLLNPEHYLAPNPLYAEFYERKLEQLRSATLCLAISEFSQDEGRTHLIGSRARFANIGAGHEPRFRPLQVEKQYASTLLAQWGVNKPFVLYTGGADERKNLPRLIHAFAELPPDVRQSHQLVLAGKIVPGEMSLLVADIKQAGLKADEIRFTNYISDDDLVALYNLCTLFVFPSWHEGFGLPALEAMACGAVVIAANASSLPEVIGLEDGLFDPLSVDSIRHKMLEALEDGALRQRLRTHGLAQAQKFTWDACAKAAIQAFETLPLAQQGSSDCILPLDTTIEAIAEKLSPHTGENELVAWAYSLGKIPHSRSRQLFVDVSELVKHDAQTGIQRVVRAILSVWLSQPPIGLKVEPVYATREQEYHYATRFKAQFLGLDDEDAEDLPIDYAANDVFIGLDFQPQTVPAQQDFYQLMRNDGVLVKFVVYDLLSIEMPDFFPRSAEKNFTRWLNVVAECDGAVCISRAVADALEAWVTQHRFKRERHFDIKWFHLGADIENSVPQLGLPEDAEDVLKRIANSMSFLAVGTLEPRKGHEQVLDAFDLLWNDGCDVSVIFVGKEGWQVEKLVQRIRSHKRLNKQLFWLSGISDEYLGKIYAASSCVIAASYGEGFGLPLVEAAQHGLPVLARDIPVFREIACENASFFDAKTSSELANAIQDWLLHNPHGKNITFKKQVLTWQQSAQDLLSNVLGN